jgi:hypothetical protein
MLHAIAGTDGLWEAQGELTMPTRAFLPLRMTVVRLPDGGLWLHSPIALDETLAAAVDALGPVRHVVAPNLFHHLHLRSARERWPQARLWGAPGLAAKRPRLRFDATLGTDATEAWGGALEAQFLAGTPRFNETVFLHRASATLICTDLVFNMRTWRGAMTGLVLRVLGTRGRLAASRLLPLLVNDRAAARAAVAEVGRWPFRRILMAHGEVYESPRAPDDLLAALELRLGPGLRAAAGA